MQMDHIQLAGLRRSDPDDMRGGGKGTAPTLLSVPERAELGCWLRDARMPVGTMDLATLEGFLTAKVIGPVSPVGEDWLPAVWARGPRGRRPECLQAPATYGRFRELILQRQSEISRQFRDFPQSFQPTFRTASFGGIAATTVAPWCIGFVERMDMQGHAWRPLRRECPALLRLILHYGTRAGWERHRVRDPRRHPAESWPQIAPAVHGIHRYWHARVRARN